MANKQTEKCNFTSDYGGGYIRPDQWVTERLCALISKKENAELPDKFWNLPKWKTMFRRQVQLAASLLVMYDEEPIARALRDKRSYNIRSFAAFNSVSFFSKILDEYQAKYDAEMDDLKLRKPDLETRSTKNLPQTPKKPNRLSILKELDVETRPIQSG